MQALKLTRKYKTYPEYKDSGVEWLGKIPEKWNLQRLKYIAPLVTKKVSKEGLQGTYIALENIETKTGKYIPNVEAVEPESIVNVFENTDVLFGKLRPYLAKVFAPTFSGTSTGEFLVLRPKEKIVQKYLFYRLLSQEIINAVNDSTYGAQMPRASWNFIGNLPTTLPSVEEQKKITDYLDKEISFIDQILEKKKKQIDLLNEKRTVVISHAITNGLSSNLNFADINTKEINKIPKGWIIQKMKFLSKKPFQYGANEAGLNDDPSQPRFIRITDIDERGNLRSDTFKSLDLELAKPYLLEQGDILFARTGATVGKSFKYRKEWGPCCYAGYLIKVSVDQKKISSDYLEYITKSDYYWKWINSVFIRSTIQNVSAEKYKDFLIPLPPIKDQEEILQVLDKKIPAFEMAIKKIEKSIILLQEFKSSVISGAVTGKIKI